MIKLDISQAKVQFTDLIDKEVMIIDKENQVKKAVILPYDVYSQLLKKSLQKNNYLDGSFSKFSGMLSKKFKTNDEKYNHIISDGN